ncbi:hypothetical protein LAZ67_14000246 [Cordylochernes scorpioides]|uniref:Transposase n=1 Tax=Cordylochernes scorpioides TaxID=51811 RepID=A0ABY6L9F9_9ARAC|nr:hypothetical protein LAZ67_14000246 [Cordylochernes scorpioides]
MQRFHELKVGDFEMRQEFAAWVFRQIDIDENWLSNFLWTDDAHFSLNGEFNIQNSRIWATENPRIFTKIPLYQPRVTVLCGFTSFIIGTFKTVFVTGERYEKRVFPYCRVKALSEITFMKDGGPPHTSRGAKQLLKDTFGENRVIGRHFIYQWPPRSTDLTPCDKYFLEDVIQFNRCSGLAGWESQYIEHDPEIHTPIEKARKLAIERTIKSHEQSKQLYDIKHPEPIFKEGDQEGHILDMDNEEQISAPILMPTKYT